MKLRPSLVVPALLLGAFTLSGLYPASAGEKKPSAELQARAKLTRAQAEKIALAQVPNATVKDAELEEEDGILRWSFDLNTPGSKKITEVGVDAVSGKVVENKVENAKDEAKEKAADAKEGKKDGHDKD